MYRDLTGFLSTPLVSVSLFEGGGSIIHGRKPRTYASAGLKPPSPARVEIPSLARDREWLAAALSH